MNDKTKTDETVPAPVESFFYTKHFPYRWSSGASIYTLNDTTYEEILSLEEAKALAEKYKVDSMGDDRCDTTYGVRYKA